MDRCIVWTTQNNVDELDNEGRQNAGEEADETYGNMEKAIKYHLDLK